MGITFTTLNGTTTAELALAGLRGDVNATVKLDGTNPAVGIDTWADYTEDGQPTAAKTTTAAGVAGVGYGWPRAHERATLDALGITLMGARLYNQATGLFTSLDPVYGGMKRRMDTRMTRSTYKTSTGGDGGGELLASVSALPALWGLSRAALVLYVESVLAQRLALLIMRLITQALKAGLGEMLERAR